MWFYVSKGTGQRAGPVPADTIAQYLVSGEVETSTLVWQSGLSGWVSLDQSPLWAELLALSNDDGSSSGEEEEGEEEEEEGSDSEDSSSGSGSSDGSSTSGSSYSSSSSGSSSEDSSSEEEEEEEAHHRQHLAKGKSKVHGGRFPPGVGAAAKLDITGRRSGAQLPHDPNDPFDFRSLEDELADPRDVYVSKVVYVKDEHNGWMTALVVAHDGHGTFTVERLQDKRRLKIKDDKILICNDETAPDMSSLEHISEPTCLFNLGSRFVQGETYTAMGVALISMNPCKDCAMPLFEDYASRRYNLKNAPHPYATAQLSYDLMCFSNCSQSILISGESGSGKSHMVKMILEYLVTRSYPADANAEENSFDQRLLCATTVLESFGHAKTQSTTNSSRFGKFMKLYYEDAKLSSAMVETFLLERGRVLRLGEHERTFNIFYQLLAGKKSRHPILEDLEDLILLNPNSYELLSHSDVFAFPGCADDEKFDGLVESMGIVGFTEDQIKGFLSIVCGLMHLGNILFETDYSEDGQEIAVLRGPSKKALEFTARSFQVDVYELHSMLTQRKVRRMGVDTVFTMSPLDASCARDWAVKSLYTALFEALTHYLNLSLSNGEEHAEMHLGSGKVDVDDDPNTFIALVDTTGFGAYELNDFEHFLINYASEALESTYCSQVFDAEIDLFAEEGIDFELEYTSERPDNHECVELLSARGKSILSTLDTVCRMPDTTDDLFLAKLATDTSVSKSKFFLEVDPDDRAYAFKVRHYATDVQYCCYPAAVELDMGIKGNAWVSRNNDLTPQGLSDLCKGSGLDEMKSLPVYVAPDIKMSHNLSTTFKPTVASVVVKTINDLNSLLMGTTCQYVRCINPNQDLTPDFFDNEYVRLQMKALKVVESCEVFKAGFSVRITFEQIRLSLGETGELPVIVDKLFGSERDELFVACMLATYGMPPDAYKLGKSMVFFREDQLPLIDTLIEGPGDNVDDQVLLVQALSEKLGHARDAYEVADRVENESEDLAHAIQEVKSSADKLNDRFKAVEAHPNSLPGRLKALSSLIKALTHIIDKVERMYKTAADSSSACREAASHCDLEEAKRASAVVGELFDQMIHQIKGVISSIEKANHSLAMIENDIRDVEQLSEAVLKQAKVEMDFKMDQMNSMSEALLNVEREKSKTSEQKRREAEKSLEARQAAEAKTASLLEEAERRRKDAEARLQAQKAEADNRLRAARKDAEKRDWAHAEARLELEERMRVMAEAHEEELRLRLEASQSDREVMLMEEMSDIELRLRAEKEHLERKTAKQRRALEGDIKALESELANAHSANERRSLLDEKAEVERSIESLKSTLERQIGKVEAQLMTQKSEAELRLIEERARLIEEKKIAEERLRLEKLRLVDERAHMASELAKMELRLAKAGHDAKLDADKARLLASKQGVENQLVQVEAKMLEEHEIIEERMHQVEPKVAKRIAAEAELHLEQERNAILEDRKQLDNTLREVTSMLKAEQSGRHDRKIESRLEGELARLAAEKKHIEKALAKAETKLLEGHEKIEERIRQVERMTTKRVNAEAEQRFEQERQAMAEAEKQIEREREDMLHERQHLESNLRDVSAKLKAEQSGRHDRKIESRLEDELARLASEKDHVVRMLQQSEARLAAEREEHESRLQAMQQKKNSSARRGSRAAAGPTVEEEEENKMLAEIRTLMDEKSNLEAMLEEKEAQATQESAALGRRKSISAQQKKKLEERMADEIRQLLEEKEETQTKLLTAILRQSQIETEKLVQSMAAQNQAAGVAPAPRSADPDTAAHEELVSDIKSKERQLAAREAEMRERELKIRDKELRERERRIAHPHSTEFYEASSPREQDRHRHHRVHHGHHHEQPASPDATAAIAAHWKPTAHHYQRQDVDALQQEINSADDFKIKTLRSAREVGMREREAAEAELEKAEDFRLRSIRAAREIGLRDKEAAEAEVEKAEEFRIRTIRMGREAAVREREAAEEELAKMQESQRAIQREMREAAVRDKEAVDVEISKLQEAQRAKHRQLMEAAVRDKEAVDAEMAKIDELKIAKQREMREAASRDKEAVDAERAKVDRLKLDRSREVEETRLQYEKEAHEEKLRGKAQVNEEMAKVQELQLKSQQDLREERLKVEQRLNEERYALEEQRLATDAEQRKQKLEWEARVLAEKHAAEAQRLQLETTNKEAVMALEKAMRDEKLAFDAKLAEERHSTDQLRMAHDATMRNERLALERRMLEVAAEKDELRASMEARFKEEKATLEARLRGEQRDLEDKMRQAQAEQERRVREDTAAHLAQAHDRAEAEKQRLREEHERAVAAHERESQEHQRRMEAKVAAMEAQLAAAEHARTQERKEQEAARNQRDEEARANAQRAIDQARQDAERRISEMEAAHATERELAEARASMLADEQMRMQTFMQQQQQRQQEAIAAAAEAAAAAAVKAELTPKERQDAERRAKLAEYALQRAGGGGAAGRKADEALQSERKAIDAERKQLEEERIKAQQQLQEMERRMKEQHAAAETQKRSAALADAERRAREAEKRMAAMEQEVQSLVEVISGEKPLDDLLEGDGAAGGGAAAGASRRSTLGIKDMMAAKMMGRASILGSAPPPPPPPTGSARRSSIAGLPGQEQWYNDSVAGAFADGENRDDDRPGCVDAMIVFLQEHCPNISQSDAKVGCVAFVRTWVGWTGCRSAGSGCGPLPNNIVLDVTISSLLEKYC